jgi:hypothetical protein
MNTYRIGSTLVRMTANQAESWNAGDLTKETLDGATVDAVVDDGEIRRGQTFDLWSWIDGNDEWPARARDMEGCVAILVDRTDRPDIVTLEGHKAIALRFIANAFEALETGTALGREQARLFDDRVCEMFAMHPKLNIRGGIVRERWLDLQKARYSFTLPTINVEIAKVER